MSYKTPENALKSNQIYSVLYNFQLRQLIVYSTNQEEVVTINICTHTNNHAAANTGFYTA